MRLTNITSCFGASPGRSIVCDNVGPNFAVPDTFLSSAEAPSLSTSSPSETPIAKVVRILGRHASIVMPILSCCIKLRSEEHTSELQSLAYLVCRLLLEKKKNDTKPR